MLLEILRAKIHRVKVTQLELNYVGSVTIDSDLIKEAGFFVHEKVQVVNIQNGARFETYVIAGPAGSGLIGLNGPCSRLAALGDVIIIMSFALMTPEEAGVHVPKVVFPDENNLLPFGK